MICLQLRLLSTSNACHNIAGQQEVGIGESVRETCRVPLTAIDCKIWSAYERAV